MDVSHLLEARGRRRRAALVQQCPPQADEAAAAGAQLAAGGKENHEIALLAEISEGTVKNYVAGILLQFGMCSRAQLISSLR